MRSVFRLIFDGKQISIVDTVALKIHNLCMPNLETILPSRAESNIKKPLKNKNFIKSVENAWNGIKIGAEESSHVRFHLLASLVVVVASAYFQITLIEWSIVLVLIAAIISAELFNSAIEDICNLLRDKAGVPYEFTGKAKDIGAGAVLVLAIASIFVAIAIFLPRIFELLFM